MTTFYQVPKHLSANRISEQAQSLLGFAPEISLVTGGSLEFGELEIYPRPRELEQFELDLLIDALRALEPIPPYYGVQCESAVDVDRVTWAEIGKALAPGKPADLQSDERIRLIAESTAAIMVILPQVLQALQIAMPPDISAMFAENLSKWQAANDISAAGDAFKVQQGWEDTDDEEK